MTAFAALLRLPCTGPVNGERLGRRMAALFRVWDSGRAPDLPILARDLLQPLGTMSQPLGMACIEAASAVMQWVGPGQQDRDDVRSLILATAPGFRATLSNPAVLPDYPVPEPLRDLLAHPRLAGLAALLTDADLLSSAGLCVQWQQIQHRRLEREMGRVMSNREDLAFLDHLVGPTFLSAPAQCFVPNFKRIRAACAERASTEH